MFSFFPSSGRDQSVVAAHRERRAATRCDDHWQPGSDRRRARCLGRWRRLRELQAIQTHGLGAAGTVGHVHVDTIGPLAESAQAVERAGPRERDIGKDLFATVIGDRADLQGPAGPGVLPRSGRSAARRGPRPATLRATHRRIPPASDNPPREPRRMSTRSSWRASSTHSSPTTRHENSRQPDETASAQPRRRLPGATRITTSDDAPAPPGDQPTR